MSLNGGWGEQIDSRGLTYAFTYSTSGTTWMWNIECGSAGSSSNPYTATANTLLWFYQGSGPMVMTFTKQ